MAEKFSRFRDAGTGIQVFLTPVPPASSASSITYVLLPFTLLFGAIRSLLIALLAGLWAISSRGAVLGRHNGFFGRSILFLLGFYTIKEEKVSLRNRGRASSTTSSIVFEPKKGDIIVANHSSWVELLYLSARFSPVFVLPIVAAGQPAITSTAASVETGAGSASPGQASNRRGTPRKNAMSANTRIETPGTEQNETERRAVKGFRRAGLWEMVRRCGYTPLIEGSQESGDHPLSLEEIAEKAEAPVVVFPELVTSNNRGLLRFSTVFPATWRMLYRRSGALAIGAGQANLYLLSLKYDPPSTLLGTTTASVPSLSQSTSLGWNPLHHAWKLAATFPAPRQMAVRLLDPEETPSGSRYLVDPDGVDRSLPDPLADACAGLIASLSRLRRTNLGWEDKEAFLSMMRSRR